MKLRLIGVMWALATFGASAADPSDSSGESAGEDPEVGSSADLEAILAETEALAGVVASSNDVAVVTNALPSFQSVYEEMQGAVTEEVDRRWKQAKVGDYVELRRPDGIIPKGLVDEVVSNVVVVKNGEFVTRVAYSELNVWDRLRFDEKFRVQWIDEHARMEARKHLIAQGQVFSKADLSKGSTTDRALDQADPEALLLVAQEFKKLGRRDADFAYAFLYYKLAAEMSEGEGLFNLGIMYLHGIGVPEDTRRGLAFISLAEKEESRDAAHFLTRLSGKSRNGARGGHRTRAGTCGGASSVRSLRGTYSRRG